MKMNRSLTATLCRVSALGLFATTGAVGLSAQQSTTLAEVHQPALFNFAPPAASSPSLDLAGDGIGYSSSVGAAQLAAAEGFSLSAGDASQPPPRRRYGRPNYSDRMHNSDGSNKISFLVGGGFTNPTDVSSKYLKISWKVQAGVGYNFNKKFGVVFQFDYDKFGLPGSVFANQAAVYNNYFNNSVDLTGLDGNTHDWSFTLNPTYNFYQTDTTGAYAVVGGGFYHKVTDFTLPQTGQYCDYYYGCYTYQANQTFDQYVSNAAGVNGGIGFTWKPSRFASERFYAEARYVFNFNSARPYNAPASNLYPGNSATTSYVPVTVGIRF